MHSKFLEYLNADEPEGVGLAELQVPWITPRRRKEAEAGTLRACQAAKSMPPHVKYRAVNMPVGEVSRLPEHGECMAIDDLMWSLAHHALAKDGIERDKLMRPFFTDKFTGQRVYMLRQVQREHDIGLHDTKRTALMPETARILQSPTRASNPRTHQPGESQSATKIFSDIKEQLTNQQRVLDDRLQVQTRMPSFSCCFARLC